MMDGDLLLLIISSPSGAGKTTLTRDLLAHFPDLTFSVSHTTRAPRTGEVDGRDYHFVDSDAFQSLVKQNRFAEWAEVHGNLYGTALSEIDRSRAAQRRGIVFDIDYQGARQIKAKCPDAVGVFILPPSLQELRRRLCRRASDTEEVIERRYHNAKHEMEQYGLSDYIIFNDNLETAKRCLRSIVYAECTRRWRMAPSAELLLRQHESETG